jgi:hypothetical protein
MMGWRVALYLDRVSFSSAPQPGRRADARIEPDGKVARLGRFILLRPDIHQHEVSGIGRGGRWLLTLAAVTS